MFSVILVLEWPRIWYNPFFSFESIDILEKFKVGVCFYCKQSVIFDDIEECCDGIIRQRNSDMYALYGGLHCAL